MDGESRCSQCPERCEEERAEKAEAERDEYRKALEATTSLGQDVVAERDKFKDLWEQQQRKTLEQRVALHEEIDEAEAERDALRDALVWHVGGETDPCRFDHHGGCQEHDPNEGAEECHIRQHRRLLGLEAADD